MSDSAYSVRPGQALAPIQPQSNTLHPLIHNALDTDRPIYLLLAKLAQLLYAYVNVI